MARDWPIPDPPDVAVFADRAIIAKETWVHRVSRDEDDGAWQFHGVEPMTEDTVSVVALGTIYGVDPSIAGIADLPEGWHAWRDGPGEPWQRARMSGPSA
jgi:hypothetical protein